ncbi:hypothetical protein [Microcoleus sp.]|uniref:hypothetical protein n=1 Tax=Microcoleus sp. TaxID=44472 RepID=UPI0035940BD6
MVKNHCPIFPLKFYIPRRTPAQKPNLAIGVSDRLRLTIAKTVRTTNQSQSERHRVQNS